jgi:hypothetical protein
MFLFSLLLLTPFGSDLDQITDRYNTKHKQAPSFEATYLVTYNGSPEREVAVAVDGTARLSMRTPPANPTYSFVCGPRLVRELDGDTQLYNDLPYMGRAFPPREPLSETVKLFPAWVNAKELKQLAPEMAKWAVVGTKEIGGKQCDMLQAKVDTREVKGQVDVAIDADSQVALYTADVSSMVGRYQASWQVTSFKRVTNFSDSVFHLNIPLGYTPFSVNLEDPMVEVGSSWPLTGWKSQASGFSLAAEVAKGPALIAILDGSQPSKNALQSLKALKASMPVVTIAAEKAQTGTDLVDPTGAALAKVNPPAYPFFALVTKEGKIKRLWMGFDPAKASAFISEVKEALTSE